MDCGINRESMHRETKSKFVEEEALLTKENEVTYDKQLKIALVLFHLMGCFSKGAKVKKIFGAFTNFGLAASMISILLGKIEPN